MKNTFVSNSIWWIAALAVALALVAVNVDAHAQDAPTPTATATETPTCWYDGDQVFCLVPPVAVTATPTETPTPTPTPTVTYLGPGPDGWAIYLPVAFGQRFVNIQPRETPEVSGDVQ